MSTTPSRREENRAVRRAAIIAVARRSFLDHGYAATSMSAIAGAVGGSKGTLWAYFPSKEALFDAVLEEGTAAFRAPLHDALRPGRDSRTTLADFARRYSAQMLEPDVVGLHRLVLGEGGRFPEIGRLFYERGPARTLLLLSTHIAAAMAAGQLRPADPFRAAEYLVLMVQLPHVQRLSGVAPTPDDRERDQRAVEAVDLFHRAYAPDAPSA